jgi:hypothetical protein
VPRSGRCSPVAFAIGGDAIPHYVGLDVSQKLTAICVVDDTGRRSETSNCSASPKLAVTARCAAVISRTLVSSRSAELFDEPSRLTPTR